MDWLDLSTRGQGRRTGREAREVGEIGQIRTGDDGTSERYNDDGDFNLLLLDGGEYGELGSWGVRECERE